MQREWRMPPSGTLFMVAVPRPEMFQRNGLVAFELLSSAIGYCGKHTKRYNDF